MISDQPVDGASTRHIDVPIDRFAEGYPVERAVHRPEAPTVELQRPAEVAKHVARRGLPFTSAAFLTALSLLIAQGVAINLAINGSPAAATVIAQLLVWLTAIPFLLAVVALVRGPHRGWAIAAMIVSVIANPLILRFVLSFFGSLS